MRRARGFTLVELVVALTLSVIVVGFASMFIKAPLDMYDTQSRRAELASAASDGWPQIREDLRTALPNSARWRRNGTIVVLEMLTAVDWVRYQSATSAPFNTAGIFRSVTVPFNSTTHYLSVNNLGAGFPGANAYALSGSITPAGSTINIVATGVPGEQRVTVTPAPTFTADSPQHRAYLVSGPVTFLCDEAAGTLQRYTGYSIAPSQTARDTAGELLAAGASAVLLAQDITRCDFAVSNGNQSATQVVTARISATRGGDTLTLVQQARLENLP